MIALIVQAKMVNADGKELVADQQQLLGDVTIMTVTNGMNKYKAVTISIKCVPLIIGILL